MTPTEQQSRQQTRQTLLDELESIRGLLHAPPEESVAEENEPPLLEIPVLQETVTTTEDLSPDPFAAIPVLHERDTGDISTPATVKNPLDDVRAAAARVAALAVRSRSHTTNLPDTRSAAAPNSTHDNPLPDHDALVQSILDALRPELEQLLHKVLAEQLSGQPNTLPRKP